ncbi:hypothetical protein [Neptuniibacter sp. QD37_11]|uniref:hypothetical protein n=1 Tax=Neptuniibacter sp. QD37_11 TaxID=3398209 RepID=UPI0039F5DD99
MAKTHIDRVCSEYLKKIESGIQDPYCQMFLSGLEQNNIAPASLDTLKRFKKTPYVERVQLMSDMMASILHSEAERQEAPPAKQIVHFHYLAYASNVFTPGNFGIFKDTNVVALQPTKQLMQRLLNMDAPKYDPEDPVVKGLYENFWYFDFPDGCYPYTQGSIRTNMGDDVRLYFRSMFWNPDFKTVGVCIQNNVSGEDYIYYYDEDKNGSGQVFHSQGIADNNSAHNILNRVMQTALILMLYYHTQQEADQTDSDALTHLPSAMIRPSVKKDKKSPKGISLFKLEQLGVSKKSESALPPSAGGREYSHGFKVSGHFRWQPHGEGRKKRKLIYIDEFTKGEGKPILDKAHLVKLK